MIKIVYVLKLAFAQLGIDPSLFPYVNLHHLKLWSYQTQVFFYCQCQNEPAQTKMTMIIVII